MLTCIHESGVSASFTNTFVSATPRCRFILIIRWVYMYFQRYFSSLYPHHRIPRFEHGALQVVKESPVAEAQIVRAPCMQCARMHRQLSVNTDAEWTAASIVQMSLRSYVHAYLHVSCMRHACVRYV